MKNKKLVIFYILWGIGSFLLFLYLLFPNDLLSEIITNMVEEQFTDVRLDFDTVEPSLPPGVKFTDIDIFYNDVPFYKADYLKISPGILSLFSSSKSVSLSAFAYKGEWDVKVKTSDKTLSADATLKEVRIDQLPLRQLIPGYRLSGLVNLNGSCDMEGTNINAADMEMDAQNFTIRFSQKMFGIRRLSFQEVKLDADAKDNLLNLKMFQIKGKQVSGDVSGTIQIKNPYEKSVLDLKGTVTPDADFIEKMSKQVPIGLLLGRAQTADGISFTLKGTIDEPDFNPEI